MAVLRSERTGGGALRIGGILGGTLLLGLSFMTCPKVLDVTIDSSWHLVLAAGLLEGWQSGVDVVYTYGPLGYFGVSHPNYVRALYFPALAVSLITGLLFAWAFIMRGACFRSWPRRLTYFSVLGTLVPILSPVGDALALLAIVCLTDLAIEWRDEARPLLAGFALLGVPSILAVLSVIKFTYLVLSIFGMSALLALSIWRRSWGQAAIAVSACLASLGISWIAAGQRLLNLPTYLRRSWDLATAYNDAMSLPPGRVELFLGVSVLAALSVLVAVGGFDRVTRASRWAKTVPLFAASALAWKASFGRYDSMHAGILFAVAAVAPFLVDPPETSRIRRARLFSGLVWVTVSIALIGAFHIALPMGNTPARLVTVWYDEVARNTHSLLNPREARNANDAAVEDESQAKALPRIREMVGHQTVDMFQPAQALLFLNGLNYKPRPAPQGLLAITPSLLELNAHFYEDPARAPTYVVFSIAPIDERFPTMEDSQALLTLMRAYDPVLVESGSILMRRGRDSVPTSGRRRLLAEHDVTMGRWIDVAATEGRYMLGSVRLRKSLAGRIRSMIYQCEPVLFEVETTDGARFARRLVPAISEEPFLIDPLMRGRADWLQFYGGGQPTHVKALRVVPGENGMWACLDPEIHVQLFDWEGPRSLTASESR